MITIFLFSLSDLSEQRKEDDYKEGYLYEMHEKIREILTELNDTVKGRCAICLEGFEDPD